MLNSLNLSVDTEFCRVMTQFGSDKGTRHHYTKIYHHLLKDRCLDKLIIGEVGIGTINPKIPSSMSHSPGYIPGASLRGWKHLFPNSSIIGFDIDDSILINEGNISSFHLDMTNRVNILETFEFRLDQMFDIFVDDGLHQEEYNWLLLENIYHLIKPRGWYFIEDIPIESKIFANFSTFDRAEHIRENFDFLITSPVPESRLFILHRK